tara:strand:+ start:2643 stop:3698 length:1056 start_codon:yes stop_codon:yes gene_type:complete
MAGLRLRKQQYESRIYMWKDSKRTEKRIPLRTKSKVRASIRHREVLKVEKDIKNGIEYNFPWLSDDNHEIELSYKGIKDVANEYLEHLNYKNLRPKTIQSYSKGLEYFSISLSNTHITEISVKSIDIFRKWLTAKTNNQSPSSTNIYLKSVRVFLNWCYDREYILKVPKIELERIDDDQVKYFTEYEFEKIISYNKYQDKRFPLMFSLYWNTGMRLSEGFYGKLNQDNKGNYWLDIPKDYNKSRKIKYIRLNETDVSTVKIIQQRWSDSGKKDDHIKYYSKVLKSVIKALGIDDSKSFHSLRHSYGVRRIIELNGNITKLRDEMGHSSVKTTEIYSKANPKRILLDFPSLD